VLVREPKIGEPRAVGPPIIDLRHRSVTESQPIDSYEEPTPVRTGFLRRLFSRG
jgi:hypothetical protein